MLSTLRERGVRLAVATSKPTVFATRILEHFRFDHLFECVAGAELDIPCIGVRWGFGTDAELTAAGATMLVADPEELLHALTCAARGQAGSA